MSITFCPVAILANMMEFPCPPPAPLCSSESEHEDDFDALTPPLALQSNRCRTRRSEYQQRSADLLEHARSHRSTSARKNDSTEAQTTAVAIAWNSQFGLRIGDRLDEGPNRDITVLGRRTVNTWCFNEVLRNSFKFSGAARVTVAKLAPAPLTDYGHCGREPL